MHRATDVKPNRVDAEKVDSLESQAVLCAARIAYLNREIQA